MPAYNEEENISETVLRCLAVIDSLGVTGEVVVTDDGSRDKTGEILAQLRSRDSRVRIETNDPNQGYGNALRRAILAASGEKIATIDSDGQFDISELPELLQAMNGFRAVTGYRKRKQDSLFRVIADRGLNLLIRMLFRIRLRDTNCAFKIYERNLIRGIEIETNGYQTPTEILLKLVTRGEPVAEAPITHSPRQAGRSALHPWRTMAEMLLFLLYMKLKQILYRRKIIANY